MYLIVQKGWEYLVHVKILLYLRDKLIIFSTAKRILNKRLHICLLTSSRLSEFTYGGEGKFTISLGNWLTSRDQSVTMIGSGFRNVLARNLPRDKVIKADKGPESKVPHKAGRIRIPYFLFLIYRSILTLLWILKVIYIHQKSPITLIHAQDTGYAGLAAVSLHKLLGIPAVISTHGIRHKTQESNIRGKFDKILLKTEYWIDIFSIKHSSYVIADNHSIRNYFEQLVPKKIDVIPIPIKLGSFEFSEENRNLTRKELGIDSNTKVVGYIGRFSPEKNLTTLLSSFSDAAADMDSTKLLLVGSGPLEPYMREYASKVGIKDKVIFCGVRYDIGRVLASLDIFVLPSYTEGVSTALLEAMACSRAIICSDISSNKELVKHNQQGLLFNPFNPRELVNTARLLLNCDQLRSYLGRNARAKVSQYDEDKIFPILLQRYENLTNNE